MTATKVPFHNHSVQSLLAILQQTRGISLALKAMGTADDHLFDDVEKACQQIEEEVRSNRLKIAVAGVIKSGKSTFINALVGKDLVKRGAGVVTAVTTRIRKGPKNRASILFKSWDSINLQLRKALTLFPDDSSFEFTPGQLQDLDIRRKKDHRLLEKLYEVLKSQFPVTQTGIQPEILMIKHALEGYDACKEFVQADENTVTFESRQFGRYKIFTSSPSTAFYVKDARLEVYGNAVAPDIEIADCQGADSIDHDQLALILNYLRSSHLIVYCISSRTGLRQADISFLNRVKLLGLLDNIVFINNCDFSEHETVNDLIKVETDIKHHLQFLEISPQLFSLSALYHLFVQCRSTLRKKETLRLALWEEETRMTAYSKEQIHEFQVFFKSVINDQRETFLISNHFNRLAVILTNLKYHAGMRAGLLSSDLTDDSAFEKRIETFEQNAARLKKLVNRTIENEMDPVKEKIRYELENILEQEGQKIIEEILDYIRCTDQIDVAPYKKMTNKGFKQIIYLMFQEFSRGFDLFVVGNVTPRMDELVTAIEKKIAEHFQALSESFSIDLLYPDPSGQLPDLSPPVIRYDAFSSIRRIKKILDPQLSTTIFEVKYTSKMKANALTGFGLHTFLGLLSAFFRKKKGFSFSPGLVRAAEKIRHENLRQISRQFEQYKVLLTEEYLMPLIDAAARGLKEETTSIFFRYDAYKLEAREMRLLQTSEKEEKQHQITSIQQQIQEQMDLVSKKLQQF